MKGLLINGPAAGRVIEAGDPPVRRGIITASEAGFAEDAYRYYLSSVDGAGASYIYCGKVEWPPEARSQVVQGLADRREPVADRTAPAVQLNGD